MDFTYLSVVELQQARANAYTTWNKALGHTKAHSNACLVKEYNTEITRRKLVVDKSIKGIFNGKGTF
tara:strand:- start:953 stop:1153 length:201 start_codon:yes stop_codon:yes gene_type:complete